MLKGILSLKKYGRKCVIFPQVILFSKVIEFIFHLVAILNHIDGYVSLCPLVAKEIEHSCIL